MFAPYITNGNRNRLTTAPPFLAVYDVVVSIPAERAVYVGCITGGHIRLWETDHRSALQLNIQIAHQIKR